ncbi:MAG TPA: hypothetical protein VFV92_09240 [Candidatus Bathyarchaeia archaeon]|nr:hypothetical protein [Candidatus Bathyarchaeia archaeon]
MRQTIFTALYGLTMITHPFSSALISTTRVRRNSRRLRDQMRHVLSLLDEMEQYRLKPAKK